MKKIILTHFSEDPFVFNRDMIYVESPIHHIKPTGVWFSDESDFGWKSWCMDEGFKTEALKHETEFEIELDYILVLDTVKKLLKFSDDYLIRDEAISALNIYIDWSEVKEKYKGILITPYSWECRLDTKTFWYYGWDCASACIWDLSALKII